MGERFKIMDKQQNHEVKNLLLVLSSAIICAGLLSLAFIYYYGPSGRYLAGNALLNPEVLETLEENNQQMKKGQKVYFVFDHIEFSYFNPQKQYTTIQKVSLEKYQQLYRLIASEKNIVEITEDIKKSFINNPVSLITSNKILDKSGSKIFQIIQFAPQDYFRVKLNGDQIHEEWIYFYQHGIYSSILQLFTEQI